MTETIQIWTDGSCRGNPGPGGWAFLKRLGGQTIHRSGGVSGRTTNSRMEMIAAIQALRSLKRTDLPTVVFTDSEFLARGMSDWLDGWVNRGWRGSGGKPVANQELWEELKRLRDARRGAAQITFQWIKAHAGDADNEVVDRLALAACTQASSVPNSVTMEVRFNPDTGLDEPLFGVEP